MLPEAPAGRSMTDREFFELNYTFVISLGSIAVSVALLVWRWNAAGLLAGSSELGERLLSGLAHIAFLWLGIGLTLTFMGLGVE